MKPPILIIDNYDSFTYNLVQIVEKHGFPAEVVKNNRLTVKQYLRFDNILISPGPGKPSEAGKILHLIKRSSPTKHILGVCLGHQAIAEAFGGRLVRLRKVSHGVRKEITILKTDDYLFGGLPLKLKVGLYHSWVVSKVKFPTCLEISAIDSDGGIMAVSHKIFDIKGIQFHPESVMTDSGKKIISNWLENSRKS